MEANVLVPLVIAWDCGRPFPTLPNPATSISLVPFALLCLAFLAPPQAVDLLYVALNNTLYTVRSNLLSSQALRSSATQSVGILNGHVDWHIWPNREYIYIYIYITWEFHLSPANVVTYSDENKQSRDERVKKKARYFPPRACFRNSHPQPQPPPPSVPCFLEVV